MDILKFLEDGHVYMLGLERLPCVSDLCRFLSREVYREAPVWQMEAAAERGTAVHQAAEALDRSGRAEIEEEYLPYLEAYAAFLREHTVSWDLIEHPDYHPVLRYAGTLDRYGTVDGRKTLLDIKTTYQVQKPLCAASLNLYRKILEARGKQVDRMVILHLQKDGRYRILDFEADNDLPWALLVLHNTLNKRKRGKQYGGRNQSDSGAGGA